MNRLHFRVKHIDTQWGRVIYKIKNPDGLWIYYGLSPETKPWSDERIVKAYRLTQGPDFEPEFEIELKNDWEFEIPRGESRVAVAIREFLQKRDAK